jgi:hypothetical protein
VVAYPPAAVAAQDEWSARLTAEPEGLFRDTSAPQSRQRLATLAEPLTVRKMWAGPSRNNAIYVQFVSRDGDNLSELRAHYVDRDGRASGPQFPSCPSWRWSRRTGALLSSA